MKRIIGMLLSVLVMLALCAAAPAEEGAAYTDVAILSTTDLHGKCWETDVLTGKKQTHNILRISSAVREIRQEYGAENVMLIDNGDLYQGTQVSEYQILQRLMDRSDQPPVMALCLKEMGYTASVLGNHEFNYPWEVMSETYRWLEEQGVPVLAANVCYDGSLEGTRAGESAFTPYVIQTVSVNGHEHRIGILGLENCDITRWDLPYNYPGLQFVHPGNDSFSMTEEVNLFLPEMRAKGCEFIIVSYHGGLGEADTELRFGENSERQALRIIAESHDIDLMINGHDHATGYSNSLIENADGRMIPVVNGGGEELTQTVFRFSENEEGALTWELLTSANLDPARYPVDEALRALVQPYAQMAEEYVEKPVATAAGEWDGKKDFYTGQTDSMDLIAKACIEMTTLRVSELADEYGKEAVMKEAGTDHLDTDLSISNVAIAGGYTVQAGPISMKDIYRLYSKNNSILVLPMTGAQIRAALEENAAQRLSARVHDGQAFIYTKDELYTNLIFGGLNFTCDLAQPVGERIRIQGFSNGRAFEEDATYLAAVSNYLLGNSRCGLRGFSAEDALWSQQEGDDETAQSLIAGYLTMKGAVTPADFGWSWNITWSGSLEDTPLPEDQTGAKLVNVPQDGQSVVIFQEPEQVVLTAEVNNDGLAAVPWEASGPALKGPRPEEAVVFTVQAQEDGTYRFLDGEGRFLAAGASGGLTLTGEPAGELCSWRLEPAYGGWYVLNVGAKGNQALQRYGSRITTYSFSDGSLFIFNFYQPTGF